MRAYDSSAPRAYGNAGKLQQVFTNLILNARDAIPDSGTITLRTRADAGGTILIEVADTGIGIAPDLLPRIFDAFEQGGRMMTSQYGGLGLGLAISKRVIDLHGGSIAAQSAGAGKGATFTLRLKPMETSLLEGPAVFFPTEAAAGSAEVLLVEDHEDTARVLRRILENAGYGVAHAASVSAAREVARKRQFDIVVSDVGLPDGSGLELMKMLRTEHGLAGIALSGFGTEDDRAASYSAGFAEHLTKPVDWPQLHSAIGRLLAEKRPEIAAVV